MATKFNKKKELSILQKTIEINNIPIVESIIRQINIFKDIDTILIKDYVASLTAKKELYSFIKKNKNRCILVTQYPDIWVSELFKKLDVKSYCSETNNNSAKLNTILKKENIVKNFKKNRVIYIGKNKSDAEAMNNAEISIAYYSNKKYAKSIQTVTDYLIFSEVILCQQLNQL